jgi:hypothetical protein
MHPGDDSAQGRKASRGYARGDPASVAVEHLPGEQRHGYHERKNVPACYWITYSGQDVAAQSDAPGDG